MSYLYGLDPNAQAKLSDQLDNTKGAPNAPGAFDNFWASVGGNLGAGALKVGEMGTYFKDPDEAAAEAMAHAIRGDDTDWQAKDWQARAEARRALAQKAHDIMPNPIKTGWASNLVGGLAQVVPTAVAGSALAGPVGAVALVGGSQGVGDYEQSRIDGVDANTAAKKAVLTGVASGLGVGIPMAKAGASLLPNLGIGVGVNVGLGMAQRAGTAAILDAGGYHDMAAQYKWLDGEAIAVDAVLGAAFGGLGHVMHGTGETAARPTPEQVDAALALNDRLHVENEAQPGVHRTAESRDAGVAAMDKAVTDMVVNDRMPDVAEAAARMDVEPNPAAHEFHTEVAKELDKELPAVELAPDVRLREAQARVDAAVRRLQEIENSPPVHSRPTITGKDGQVYFDTRGSDVRFHGTSRELPGLSNEYAMTGDSRNIYGQGFYTTDAADIAHGYMRKGKGGTPTLYRVHEKHSVKLYDMEAPMTEDVRAKAESIFGDLYADENGETGERITNLRELYDEVRAQSREEGITRDEVQEMFDSLRYVLEEQGYEGYSHIGGIHTGNEAHRVRIYWKPEDQIAIHKGDVTEFHADAEHRAAIEEAIAERRAARLDLERAKEEAAASRPIEVETRPPAVDAEPLKPHDNTPEGMAKAGDVQPIEDAMAKQVLASDPDLEIPVGVDAEGNPTMRKFSDVMADMDRDIAQAGKEGVLHDVAVACFLRG